MEIYEALKKSIEDADKNYEKIKTTVSFLLFMPIKSKSLKTYFPSWNMSLIPAAFYKSSGRSLSVCPAWQRKKNTAPPLTGMENTTGKQSTWEKLMAVKRRFRFSKPFRDLYNYQHIIL